MDSDYAVRRQIARLCGDKTREERLGMIVCYPCTNGVFIVPHACTLEPSRYKPAPLPTLANQLRERTDGLALKATAQQVAYLVNGKEHTTMPAAVRAALRNGATSILMRTWWPRTPAGELAASKALVWVAKMPRAGYASDYFDRYDRECSARAITGPNFYTETEIPL